MSKFKIAFLALAAASSIAGAATQHTLGATSTRAFTNTFAAGIQRQVHVLGLLDAVITPGSANVENSFNTP